MKACARYQKLLAWLILGLLDEREAEELRAHVSQCAGCRGYLDELTKVSGQLRRAEAPAELPAPPFLHRRVSHALRRQRPGASFRWGLAVPAVGLAALALALFLRPTPAPPVSRPRPGQPARALAPTMLNYQIAANQSLDKLDEMLSEQARDFQPPPAVYRAGSFPPNLGAP